MADDGNIPETGQDILDTLLKRCYIVAENALQKWAINTSIINYRNFTDTS